ncbi:MAG: PHP domain-containing protein [Roseovarius sp.]|uniref:PHP domain-containing protein n=1 Tax=Roseovarius sp. TaxID=1486281 RepID=UPI001B6A496C|nr:CehA/McbA family metallohydrolase [Roseovarius sp.]MBQ0752444.1 PHP domain-containing protein [Roseovarius sp.]MBQ0812145.1 PHP domain-containing protein [Roseovarius sp.]
MLSAFSAPGTFYRGNLHTHSTLSDGCLDPQEVCRRYRAEGYDFISLTDHFIGEYGYPVADTRAWHSDAFTTIPGAELHSGAMENGQLWHILAVGLPYDFVPPNAPDFKPVAGQETGPELAKRARDAGAFVAIAHPHWSGLTLADARSITAAHSVEIYNHGCAVGCDREGGGHVLDLLLSEGRDLTLIATDDAHFTEPDHFGGWVMVKAQANEPALLLEALKNGAFYSSQGPEIRAVTVTDDAVTVETTAVATIILQGHGQAATALHGHSMTRGTVSLDRFRAGGWLRITVVDAAGKRAWTNPLRFT